MHARPLEARLIAAPHSLLSWIGWTLMRPSFDGIVEACRKRGQLVKVPKYGRFPIHSRKRLRLRDSRDNNDKTHVPPRSSAGPGSAPLTPATAVTTHPHGTDTALVLNERRERAALPDCRP
jgi:hypothetical protein